MPEFIQKSSIFQMLTQEEKDEWRRLYSQIPRELYVEWMRELHRCELSEVVWNDDDYDSPLLTFVANTLCCHLLLSEPPEWLVFRVMKRAL